MNSMNTRRISKGLAMVLATALVGAGLPTPVAATQATAVTAAAANVGPDQTYENGYGRLVVADILAPSAGRHERRTTFTSFRGGRFELSADMITGEVNVVVPSGSLTLHFLPNNTAVLSVAAASGPVTTAIVSKDGVLGGAHQATLVAAMQGALGPSRQVVDDLLNFLAVEGFTTGAQDPGSAVPQVHALLASPACNKATLAAAAAAAIAIGAGLTIPFNWLIWSGAMANWTLAYNNELVQCQIP